MTEPKKYLSNEKLQRVNRAWKYIKPRHRAKLYLIALWWSLSAIIDVRAWHRIPALRPHKLMMPAALLQFFVFVLAALTPGQFMVKFMASNFIIAAGLMLPLTLQSAKIGEHEVKPRE